MRRTSYLPTLGLAALASLGIFASTAAAAPGHGGVQHASKPNKTHYATPETIHFEVEYENQEFYGNGMVKCKGRHQTNEKKGFPGTETNGGRDIERCHTVNGLPFEKLTGGTEGEHEFPGPSNVWESDYFLFVRHEGGIRSYDMKYKVAKNDKSFHVVAYYNE